MFLSEIFIYPVKSFRGIPLESATVERAGLWGDRRWMAVDTSGRFLSQRENPLMATVATAVVGGDLVLSCSGSEIRLPVDSGDLAHRTVKIWNDAVSAVQYPDHVSRWLTSALGVECSLVKMSDTYNRPVDPDFVAAPDDHVSLADAFPYLLVGQGSLDDLNRRLADPVPMNRFRPNFVVEGSEAFAEDSWRKIRIGDVVFKVVKPCARCVVTTIDQERGERGGTEPLRTLAGYRTIDRNGVAKVLFGQNLIALESGKVRIGDRVELLAE